MEILCSAAAVIDEPDIKTTGWINREGISGVDAKARRPEVVPALRAITGTK